MKILIDENIPNSCIQTIQEHYEVLDIKKQQRGLRDSAIIRIAKEQEYVILTQDKDFLKLYKSMNESFSAIIIKYEDNKIYTKHLLCALEKISSFQTQQHAVFIVSEKAVTIHNAKEIKP